MKLLQILYAALWAYDHGYGMEADTVDTIHSIRTKLESEITPEQSSEQAHASARAAFLM